MTSTLVVGSRDKQQVEFKKKLRQKAEHDKKVIVDCFGLIGYFSIGYVSLYL